MLEARAWDRLARLLRLATLVAAVAYPLLYLVLVALRIGYPFELEWIEGGSLDHVRRILSGRPLYGPPSLEFTPFFYTPLYYYVSAGAALVLGVDFLPLRLVSALASLGCFAGIAVLVRRETGSGFAGLLASGLFAATYRLSGAWLDLARVDSLLLMVLLLAALVLRRATTGFDHALAAGLLFAAFLTKQTALVPVAALSVLVLVERRRQAAAFFATLAVVFAVGIVALDRASDGWFSYYTFLLSGRHPVVLRRAFLFVTRDVFAPLAIASMMAAFYFTAGIAEGRREAARFQAWWGGGMIGLAILGRMNVGGYDNVLLPSCAAVAVLFGLGFHAAREAVRQTSSPAREAYEALLYAACLVQFGALVYNPLAQVPTARDLEAGRRLVAILRGVDGPVFIPGHPYLLALAGKAGHTHFSAINAIDSSLGHGTPGAPSPFAEALERAFRERRYAAVVLDSGEWFGREVEGSYRDAGPVFDDERVFWPVTGARLRPQRIYFPRETGPVASAPSISPRMDATAPAGSGDSVIGRPTTR